MKFIFIIFFILFSNSIFANEEDNNEVEVINLYESKSLDQMVLDNLNKEEIIEEEVGKTINEIWGPWGYRKNTEGWAKPCHTSWLGAQPGVQA